MIFRLTVIALILLLPRVAVAEESLKGIAIEDIEVIRISPQDARAVIKAPGHDLTLLKVGDEIGKNGRVSEITNGRIVIEEESDQARDKIIIRIEDGKQRIERLTRSPQNRPLIYRVR